MRRVSVIGCSGSGKTTLARALAERIGAEHVELDSIYHQPGWKPLPRDEFRRSVARRLEADSWVVDGNYRSNLEDIVWGAADTVVWLDLPRSTVMRSVVPRTLRRVFTGEELWNGNRERWFNLLDPWPARNILLWAWFSHPRLRRQAAAAMDDPRWNHLTWLRLRSRGDAERWLSGLEAP